MAVAGTGESPDPSVRRGFEGQAAAAPINRESELVVDQAAQAEDGQSGRIGNSRRKDGDATLELQAEWR